MSQSYTNPGGSGTRTTQGAAGAGFVNAIDNGIIEGGAGGQLQAPDLVNGTYASYIWFASVSLSSNYWLKFYFNGMQVIIDEAKWYQSSGTSQGTWQWQGSNDDVNWTDIGSTFTLGGATTDTITALNGNTTAYTIYRMLGISGTTSTSPYTTGIDFSINDPTSSYSYDTVYGYGTRVSPNVKITQTSGGIFQVSTGSASNAQLQADLLTGATGTYTNNVFFANGTTISSTYWIQFQFNNQLIITDGRLYMSSDTAQGVWQWQGSNNGSSWTDIGSSWSIQAQYVNFFCGALSANTTPYYYYRMLGVSGTSNDAPWVQQFEFFDVPTAVSGNPSGLQTGTVQWEVPSDWNNSNNKIECIGGGGAGAEEGPSTHYGAGGGGGGYAYVTNQTYTPGNVITIQVGQGGQTTTASGTASLVYNNADSTVICEASGGQGGVYSGSVGGTGGTNVTGSGYSGGSGGSAPGNHAGGGGGGAAGPNGNGGNGGTSANQDGGCGGGGNGGGSNGGVGATDNGGTGGNNFQGSGGGLGEGISQNSENGTDGGGGGGGGNIGGQNENNKAGGPGTDLANSSYGGGGGGGGGAVSVGGNGGLYGGGGGGNGTDSGSIIGIGEPGLVLITYTPASSNTLVVFWFDGNKQGGFNINQGGF